MARESWVTLPSSELGGTNGTAGGLTTVILPEINIYLKDKKKKKNTKNHQQKQPNRNITAKEFGVTTQSWKEQRKRCLKGTYEYYDLSDVKKSGNPFFP